jgi:hypothetical protein
VDVDPTVVRLTWLAPTGEGTGYAAGCNRGQEPCDLTGYVIYYRSKNETHAFWHNLTTSDKYAQGYNVTGLQQNTKYRFKVVALNPTGPSKAAEVGNGTWFMTGTTGSISVAPARNSSLTRPGMHLDQAMRLRMTITADDSSNLQIGGTEITLSSSGDAECYFSDSETGTYSSDLAVSFRDRVMERTDGCWMKCSRVLASAESGPYIYAAETMKNSSNILRRYDTFPERVIVYNEPARPESPQTSEGGPSSVLLSWDAPFDNYNNITQFMVESQSRDGKADERYRTAASQRTLSFVNLTEYTPFNFTVAAKNLAGYGRSSNATYFKTGVTGVINVTMSDGGTLHSYPGFEVGTVYRLRVVLTPTPCSQKRTGCAAGTTTTHQVGGTIVEIALTSASSQCQLARNATGIWTSAQRLNVSFLDDVEESDAAYLLCLSKSTSVSTRLTATEVDSNSVNEFSSFRSLTPILAYDEPNAPTDVAGISPPELLYSANISWSRPDSNNADIDLYEVSWENILDSSEGGVHNVTSVSAGAAIADSTSTPAESAVISGRFRNGQRYYFYVRAHNKAGFGPRSAATAAVTIVPGHFGDRPTFALGTYQASATTYFEVGFISTGNITTDGKFEVYLPQEFRGVTSASIDSFIVENGAGAAVDHVTGLGESFSATLGGGGEDGGRLNVTFTRPGGYPVVPIGANVTVRVSNLLSSMYKTSPAATHDVPAVRTLLANDDPIDEASLRFNREFRALGVVITPPATIFNVTLEAGHLTIPTGTSIAVTLTGTRFGSVSNERVIATYGTNGTNYKAANCSVTIAESEIVCYSVPGGGANHTWRVSTTATVWSPFSDTHTSYTAPRIMEVRWNSTQAGAESVQQKYLDTRGRETLTITGKNFGPRVAFIDLLTLGGRELGSKSNPLCTITVPHSEIQCDTLPGTGASHFLRLKIRGQKASCRNETETCTLSYYAPRIDRVTGPSGRGATLDDNRLATRGNESVVLDGDMFGPAGTLLSGFYTNDQLENTLSGQIYAASGCNVTLAHVQITCTTVAGVGTEHHWFALIDGQTSNISTDTTSYRRPTIVEFDAASMAPFGIATDGRSFVTLTGQNFGPPLSLNNNVTAEYTNPSLRGLAGQNFKVSPCVVLSHETMRCPSAVGIGSDHRWRVMVGFQWSNQSNVTTRYSLPSISALELVKQYDYESETSLTALSTRGGQTIYVNGSNFGPIERTNDASATYFNQRLRDLAGSRYRLNCTVIVAHKKLSCITLPGP